MDTQFNGSEFVSGSLVDPTLLRTRAWCELSYADENVPPQYPGNASDPMVFRVIASDESNIPTGNWWEEADELDDVIFSPLQWQDTWLLPADTLHGNPRTILSTARLNEGLADSHGMRKFEGTTAVVLTWFAGPALGSTSIANPTFTVRLWFRALIEATI
jgi:hypothetical protein